MRLKLRILRIELRNLKINMTLEYGMNQGESRQTNRGSEECCDLFMFGDNPTEYSVQMTEIFFDGNFEKVAFLLNDDLDIRLETVKRFKSLYDARSTIAYRSVAKVENRKFNNPENVSWR